eukprot:4839174-Pleurochrysis_carterae.AAC.1
MRIVHKKQVFFDTRDLKTNDTDGSVIIYVGNALHYDNSNANNMHYELCLQQLSLYKFWYDVDSYNNSIRLRQSDGSVYTMTLRPGNYDSTGSIVNEFALQLIITLNALGYLDDVVNSRTNVTLTSNNVMVLNISVSEVEYNRILASPFALYNVHADGDSHIIMGGKKRTFNEMNDGVEGSLKVELSETTGGGYLLQISGYYQMRTASETHIYLCSDDVSYNMEVSTNN